MHILHVCRQYYPGIGGLENFTRELCEAQVRAGHKVSMVTLDRIFDGDGAKLPKREVINGVEVIRLHYLGSKRYPLAFSVLRHLKGVDLIHVHAVDFFADFLAWTQFLHRKPMVISTHGGFFHTDSQAGLKRLYFRTMSRFAMSRYRAVIACSINDRTLFSEICKRNLTLIENGVDIDKFDGIARTEARSVIYFGRLAPNKRLPDLIRWFGNLWRLDQRWKLIIAGKPMGVTVEELSAVAANERIANSIEFHTSPTDAELSALIAQSSIFASASAHEGFGISLVEAASAGLYPVVSDIPAHRRSCERLQLGSLIDFTDRRSPARVLREIKEARHSGEMQRARERLESFSWRQVTQEMFHIYEEALGTHNRLISNVSVSVMNQRQAVDRVSRHIDARDGKVICFCNAHTANLARRDKELARALDDALVLNDGIGMDIASRLIYGARFPHNLNGTDFVPLLLASQKMQTRVYLVGSAPGVAARAAHIIEQRYPHVEVVGTQHGFFDAQEEKSLAQDILSADPDLVIAGMGNPRQEIWAAKWAPTLRRPIICAGALLDFTAGMVRRAPPWVRRLHFEWAYRLGQEPARLANRYLVGNAAFLAHILQDAVRGPDLKARMHHPSLNVARGADAA
ncbi:MAG: WecB/TagA/CpsF family glycosyltransferase [Sphingobium sp.]